MNSLSRLESAVSALSNPGTEREFFPIMFFASSKALFSESARFSRDCWWERVGGRPCQGLWFLLGVHFFVLVVDVLLGVEEAIFVVRAGGFR